MTIDLNNYDIQVNLPISSGFVKMSDFVFNANNEKTPMNMTFNGRNFFKFSFYNNMNTINKIFANNDETMRINFNVEWSIYETVSGKVLFNGGNGGCHVINIDEKNTSKVLYDHLFSNPKVVQTTVPITLEVRYKYSCQDSNIYVSEADNITVSDNHIQCTSIDKSFVDQMNVVKFNLDCFQGKNVVFNNDTNFVLNVMSSDIDIEFADEYDYTFKLCDDKGNEKTTFTWEEPICVKSYKIRKSDTMLTVTNVDFSFKANETYTSYNRQIQIGSDGKNIISSDIIDTGSMSIMRKNNVGDYYISRQGVIPVFNGADSNSHHVLMNFSIPIVQQESGTTIYLNLTNNIWMLRFPFNDSLFLPWHTNYINSYNYYFFTSKSVTGQYFKQRGRFMDQAKKHTFVTKTEQSNNCCLVLAYEGIGNTSFKKGFICDTDNHIWSEMIRQYRKSDNGFVSYIDISDYVFYPHIQSMQQEYKLYTTHLKYSTTYKNMMNFNNSNQTYELELEDAPSRIIPIYYMKSNNFNPYMV